jgi:DNA gyrase subunit B
LGGGPPVCLATTETTTVTTTDIGYSADNLQVLKGLDAVRKRPGMYIGSTDERGLNHLVWEIVDNAVDEALGGHCSRIDIRVHADDSIEVRDNGRGIPVDVNKQTGLTGVELVYMELHGGGKFGGGAYGASGGLHGVGASVVNALSCRLEAEVDRGGKTHRVQFNYAEPGIFDVDGGFQAKGGLQVVGKAAGTGTRVRFWPDRKIFLAAAEFDLEKILTRARQTAFLVPGLEITVTDERGETPVREVFKFDGGMSDFVDYHAADRPVTDTILITGEGNYTESVPVLDGDKMTTQNVDRVMGVEVALRWGTGYDADVRSFVNIVSTPKGGTHVTGFERALVRLVNEQLKAHKVAKANDAAVIKDDIQEGLTAVVLVRIAEPQFEGQTKEILGTPAATKIVGDVITEQLRAWFTHQKHKAQAKAALEKILQAAKTRLAARQHKETIRRKNALESSSMPAKLADCRSTDLERAELFIVEGDSAMGTAKKGRDSEYQALMPIRGKILNTQRATEKQMLDNDECAAVITAMGAGSGRSFDLDSIRYGKLIVLADADVDGSHIRCLLLTLCFRYMRPLLEAGRVYAAMPPLHLIKVAGPGNEHYYTYTQAEMEAKVAELKAAGKNVKEVQRYKGLGEMDADQLAETTLDITKRRLRRMTVDEAEEVTRVFEMLMGNDVAGRKTFIVEEGGLLDPALLDI